MIGASKFKVGHMTLTMPLLRVMLGFDTGYLCTTFDHYSFSRSRGMVSVHQNLNSTCDLTTFLSGMICHQWVCTCYGQPTYQL